MKNLKKLISFSLAICMVLSMFTVLCTSATAEEETLPKWINRNGKATGTSDYRYFFYQNNYANNQNTNAVTAENDPSTMNLDFNPVIVLDTNALSNLTSYKTSLDTLAGGTAKEHTFYEISDFNNNHYVADKTAGSGMNDLTRVGGALYNCSYWLSNGITFTAPKSGTIKITYQLAQWSAANNDGVLLIGKNEYDASNVGVSTKAEYTVAYKDKSDVSATYTATLDVTEGDTVYMIINSKGNQTVAFFYVNEVEYTALKKEASASVIGRGLATTDELLVRFFVKYNYEAASFVTVKATVATANGDVVLDNLTATQWIDTEGTYGEVITADDFVYYYTVPVTAKQMTEVITLSVKDGDTELLTEGNTYCVQDYCMHYIDAYNADNTQNPAVAKTCASMLLYGRMTQLAFNYNTENLPTVDTDILSAILDGIN